MRRAILLLAIVACAPTVDGPVERQAAIDRDDAAHLGAQLGALPGVVRAEVILHRPARDPLSLAPPTPATASIVLIVDDRAETAKLERFTRVLARANSVEPTVVIDVGAHRAELASVGPFTVEARSKSRLKATFVIALALIAGLAGWIATLYYRRGNSAQ
jgi:hypothetical protein